MKNFPREMQHASGVPLLLDPTRLLMSFRQAPPRPELEKILIALDLQLENGDEASSVPGETVNHTSERFWVQARRAINQERFETIEKLATQSGLAWLGPVYRLSGEQGRRALVAPLPDVLVVRLRERVGVEHTGGEHNVAVTVADAAAADNGAEPVLREVAEKSRYLNGLRYFEIVNVAQVNAYELKARLEQSGNQGVADVQFETMPLITPTAIVPSDTLFAQQWDMTRIQAGGPGSTGWDLGSGAAAVVICVLDAGCDLSHPDLRYSTPGINLGTMLPNGGPTGNHGTACAGIAAATFNNALGVAGVAGNARIMPLAFQNWSDTEVAAGINWATANGAEVISMSFGNNGWSAAIIDPAIQNAFNNDVVMCVATHNYNGAITYPATNALVMAVGASDQADNRKNPMSPDGEGWGSNFGARMSVVAPGVLIPTTDRQGAPGYNTASGTAGDYAMTFNGTSAATPHVAGLAALVRSLYPALTNVQIRALIERSAQKAGSVAYAETAGYPNGSWNQEMGYGRINVLRALDAADVMIKDAPSDSGAEPFTGGNFWDFSDIVVRINDDGVFVPNDPLRSKNVERGQANYIYVRVTNKGPRAARNVTVGTRITPYVGLEFVWPQDWTQTNPMHVAPAVVTASFASIAAGASVLAKFRIEAAQTEALYGWVSGAGWHPCLLASVTADNDYAFSSTPVALAQGSVRRNNLAQRNLSVIDVLGGASASFPFIAGNLYNAERRMTLVVDRSRLPAGMPLLLSLDDDGGAFPQVDFGAKPDDVEPVADGCGDNALVFLERTRITTKLGCCPGVMTLEKGSRFDCNPVRKLGRVTVEGGDVVLRGDKRYVQVTGSRATVHMEKAANTLYAMSLQTTVPAGTERDAQLMIALSQQNTQGDTVGGAAVVYVLR
ncbi:MAG: S8 family serine peptidase [Pseudomonadota bacterium]